MGAAFRAALAVAGTLVLATAGSAAEPVRPLDVADCADVRHALEAGVPFIPGFRMLDFELPTNASGLKGKVCRLLTVGTGAHMETAGIASLDDMRGVIRGALTRAGWFENDAAKRFAEQSAHGRTLFALARKDAMCVISVVVDMVEGVQPDAAAMKDGKVLLSALKPYQREWWIALDCFKL